MGLLPIRTERTMATVNPDVIHRESSGAAGDSRSGFAQKLRPDRWEMGDGGEDGRRVASRTDIPVCLVRFMRGGIHKNIHVDWFWISQGRGERGGWSAAKRLTRMGRILRIF